VGHLCLISACDFQNILLFLLYLDYDVTSNVRHFSVSDFQILKLTGSPGVAVNCFMCYIVVLNGILVNIVVLSGIMFGI
jgi:hypothetical protein